MYFEIVNSPIYTISLLSWATHQKVLLSKVEKRYYYDLNITIVVSTKTLIPTFLHGETFISMYVLYVMLLYD